MANANELFLELAKKFPDHKIGKMFGKLCLKNNNGKSCAMVFNDNIVVKLNINDIIKTQELKGVNFFEPMAGKPMKEWLQVPISYADKWEELIVKPSDYV